MSVREINIRLLTWGAIQVTTEELLSVARHRHMLLLYAVSLFAMYSLRYRQDEPGWPHWLNIMIYLAGHLSPLPLIIGLFLIFAYRTKGTAPVQVNATPLIFLTIFLSAISIELIVGWMGGQNNLSIPQLLAWSVLHTLYGEFLGAMVGNFMLQRMLAQIRRENDAPSVAVVSPPEPHIPGKPEAAPRPTLTVGGQTFPAEDLLHARAEGNYVDLTFTTGRLYTLTTLTSVTEQLADVDGCLLSRSVWISAAATTGYERDGANYVVTTSDDRQFRVARSRNDRVLPWLQERFAAK